MPRDDYEYEDTELDLGRKHERQSMFETPILQKIFAAIAAATVVGGGTVVLNTREHVAVLEYADSSKEQRLQRIETKLDVLIDRTQSGRVANSP